MRLEVGDVQAFAPLFYLATDLHLIILAALVMARGLNVDEPEEEVSDSQLRPNDSLRVTQKMTVAERDAALINAWKERQGSLANTEFEDSQVAGGYRRNVVRLQSE